MISHVSFDFIVFQCQAASHETLEELRACNSAKLQAQQERHISELERDLEHMRTGNAKLLQELEERKVQQQYLSSSLQDEKALKISLTAKLDRCASCIAHCTP